MRSASTHHVRMIGLKLGVALAPALLACLNCELSEGQRSSKKARDLSDWKAREVYEALEDNALLHDQEIAVGNLGHPASYGAEYEQATPLSRLSEDSTLVKLMGLSLNAWQGCMETEWDAVGMKRAVLRDLWRQKTGEVQPSMDDATLHRLGHVGPIARYKPHLDPDMETANAEQMYQRWLDALKAAPWAYKLQTATLPQLVSTPTATLSEAFVRKLYQGQHPEQNGAALYPRSTGSFCARVFVPDEHAARQARDWPSSAVYASDAFVPLYGLANTISYVSWEQAEAGQWRWEAHLRPQQRLSGLLNGTGQVSDVFSETPAASLWVQYWITLEDSWLHNGRYSSDFVSYLRVLQQFLFFDFYLNGAPHQALFQMQNTLNIPHTDEVLSIALQDTYKGAIRVIKNAFSSSYSSTRTPALSHQHTALELRLATENPDTLEPTPSFLTALYATLARLATQDFAPFSLESPVELLPARLSRNIPADQVDSKLSRPFNKQLRAHNIETLKAKIVTSALKRALEVMKEKRLHISLLAPLLPWHNLPCLSDDEKRDIAISSDTWIRSFPRSGKLAFDGLHKQLITWLKQTDLVTKLRQCLVPSASPGDC